MYGVHLKEVAELFTVCRSTSLKVLGSFSGTYIDKRCTGISIGHFRVPKKSHFQSEAKCEAIDMKMIFNYDANKTHFHNKGFALSLVLKVRFFGTRKWPIGYPKAFFSKRG